jgi:hypothetical protein
MTLYEWARSEVARCGHLGLFGPIPRVPYAQTRFATVPPGARFGNGRRARRVEATAVAVRLRLSRNAAIHAVARDIRRKTCARGTSCPMLASCHWKGWDAT